MKNIPEEIYSGKFFLTKYYNQTDCMPWLYLIKKDVIVNNEIYFKRIINEDFLFTPIIIYLSDKIKYKNLLMYHYLIRENSITRDKNFRITRFIGYIEACKGLQAFLATLIIRVRKTRSRRKDEKNQCITDGVRHRPEPGRAAV